LKQFFRFDRKKDLQISNFKDQQGWQSKKQWALLKKL